MDTAIEPKRLYTEEETRKLLGGLGKTKFYEYRKSGCIVPFRLRPTLYLGSDIERAMERIMELRRGDRSEDYGIR